MTSTLQVQNLQGPTSGSNTNQVLLGSGQKIIATDQGSVVAPGMVVQVVNNTTQSYFNTTSGSFVDTPLSSSITPKSTSSKILIEVHVQLFNGSGNQQAIATVFRGNASTGTNLGQVNSGIGATHGGTYVKGTISGSLFDTPNTTSPVTYQIAMRKTGNGTAYFNVNSDTSTITLMEIAQ